MRSLSNLGKISVLAGWVAIQAVLVLGAGARPEHAFGFRMFSESSTLEYRLEREVLENGVAQRLHCAAGRWQTLRADGKPRFFDWHDWVKRPELGQFDRQLFASYGLAAQRSRLHAALDYVSGHVADDEQTLRFVLVLTTRHNGGPPQREELFGPWRGGQSTENGARP